MINKEAIDILSNYSNGYFGHKIDDVHKAHELAIKALENSSWIPVSERLPEKNVDVIVSDIETKDSYCSWYIGNGFWECDNGVFNNRIIAWMPLPEPYKREETDENNN